MPHTIDWRDWSEASFRAASAEDKPILLSIITAWSEECSAMDATTYASPDVIALVESRFVAIRVDADRRPDVSERYNLGGWPTTAVLTPDGHLLNGGTYFGRDMMSALLGQAADSWRNARDEIRARLRAKQNARHESDATPGATRLEPDVNAEIWLRSQMVDQFDPSEGGFGRGPKYAHARAVAFALALVDEDQDLALRQTVETTLESIGRLWDPDHGGFFRYAERPDWSHPGTEKTLEDNGALLNLYLDAAVRLHSDDYRDRAAELVRWLRNAMADSHHGGFYNSQAAVSRVVDRSMYVDRNADVVAAFLRASAAFQDPWLRDFAVKSLETVILPGYKPGAGVAHDGGTDAATPEVRGLLADQVRAASALIWAHVFTEQLPYSMLALELVRFAIRTMWDDRAGCFRDHAHGESQELGLLDEPVHPFELNCDAACVLDRLSTITGEQEYRDRALVILGSLAGEYQRHGLFGAPYALAVREVVNRRAPLGLTLSHVDWNLERN